VGRTVVVVAVESAGQDGMQGRKENMKQIGTRALIESVHEMMMRSRGGEMI